ncbi:MAG: Gfo/Idh/MocA family protein [Candidatus Helarchaeota archaeon]
MVGFQVRKISIGVIGAGLISMAHGLSLKGIIDNNLFKDNKISLIRVADIDEKASLRFSNMTGVMETTKDPMEIIDDDSINVIYILTPTKFHKELFISAANRGKHIFCEKPLAFSSNDIKDMIKARDKNKIFAQVGLVLRHCPVFWFVKKTIDDNKEELGKLLTVLFHDDQEWPIAGSTHFSDWRRDKAIAHAGCLFEHSIHDVDILEYIFGPMKNLFARVRYVSSLAQIGLEDSANLNFEFENGGTGTLMSLWHKIKRDFRHLEIFFEHGCIIMDGYTGHNFKSFRLQLGKNKPIDFKWKDIRTKYYTSQNLPNLKTGVEMYSNENFSFLKSIIDNKPSYPSLEIGLRAHQLVETAYESSKSQKTINLF